MNDFSIKVKGYFKQIKDFIIECLTQLKHVSKEVWLKNTPVFAMLLIYLIYFIFSAKVGALGWTVVFLIGFGYAIFALNYWKKDREFNIYLSLILLVFSLALAGYEGFQILLERIL